MLCFRFNLSAAGPNHADEVARLGGEKPNRKMSARPGSAGKRLAPITATNGNGNGNENDNDAETIADKYFVCTECLMEGYVQAFVDLFYLTHTTQVLIFYWSLIQLASWIRPLSQKLRVERVTQTFPLRNSISSNFSSQSPRQRSVRAT